MSKTEPQLTELQLQTLRNMLGWGRTPDVNKIGWRNHAYAPKGESTWKELERMGYVKWRSSGDTRLYHYFTVTQEGAKAAGMSEARIKEVFREWLP